MVDRYAEMPDTKFCLKFSIKIKIKNKFVHFWVICSRKVSLRDRKKGEKNKTVGHEFHISLTALLVKLG